MDARFVSPQWYAGYETAEVRGAQFCPESPDVLFIDLTYTGGTAGHSFVLVADSAEVDAATIPVRITCRIVDLPLGSPDTVTTSTDRNATQHNLRWFRVEGVHTLVLDLGGAEVVYAY